MYSFLYLIEQPCLAALKKTLEINVIQISTWITLALLYVKCVHFSWLIFSGIWLVARNRCVPTFVPYDKSNQNNNMENVQIQVSYRVCVSLFVFCNVFFWINSERQQRTATNGDPYMPSQLRMRHKKKNKIIKHLISAILMLIRTITGYTYITLFNYILELVPSA